MLASFRDADGAWSEAIEIGDAINRPGGGRCPNVSADGRVMFFNSQRLGSTDIFWVDASFLQELRAK